MAWIYHAAKHAEHNERAASCMKCRLQIGLEMCSQTKDGSHGGMVSPALPAPINVLRLSFDYYDEYVEYIDINQNMLKNIWLWHETLGNQADQIKLTGICDICEDRTVFTSKPKKSPDGDAFGFRVQWGGNAVCDCSMCFIDRSIVRVLLDEGSYGDHIYHVGHHSRFRRWISERFQNVTASQYEEGRQPGEIDGGIRYEDITMLSFPDKSFDVIVCSEVLEHIPDYMKSLAEMCRVLRPGGRALLTFPWRGGKHYDHFVRAELMPDGTIQHFHPPEYHGDPASKDGILSFRSFGWRILDELRDSGFNRASAKFIFGPIHGYMNLLTPVIVATR